MRSQSADSQFQQQMARIMFITGKTTQCQLAEFLGIKQASISEAMRRGKIPATWLVTLVQKKCLNPDWVLDGVSPIYLHRYAEQFLADMTLEDLESEIRRRKEKPQ